MNPIAISTGSTVIYWSAVVIALGIAAGFALSYSLYISHGGRSAAMWLLLPLALLFSVPLCRAIHWYCHPEQYTSFIRAITDYSTGSYCLPGALLGTFLAALVVRGLGLTGNIARLLDCVAPGGALIVVFIRLSALFNSSCRSKIAITTPLLQHLPIGSGITNSMGAVEYRFATFFVQAILMLCVTVLLLYFFFARRRLPMKEGCPRDGNVTWMFLTFHSAVELLMDSTRYDSSFMHFNAKGCLKFWMPSASLRRSSTIRAFRIRSTAAAATMWRCGSAMCSRLWEPARRNTLCSASATCIPSATRS